MGRNWTVFSAVVKSMFTCVHFADDCTSDERVKKVDDDGQTEMWNCYCTCKCGKSNIKKTLPFKKSYLDRLRAAGLE